MAMVMRQGMAARLVARGFPRFHGLDMVGMPLCMRIDRPPLYPIDHEHQLGREFVPAELRCHRAGCVEVWPKCLLS